MSEQCSTADAAAGNDSPEQIIAREFAEVLVSLEVPEHAWVSVVVAAAKHHSHLDRRLDLFERNAV